MLSASPSDNEEQRLAALYNTGLLDSPAESIFDTITKATCTLLDMPLSLIALVDKERIWLKSSQGLEGISEIEREVGFCSHTITQTSMLEVKDATQNPLFRQNPLVLFDPHIIHYAGVPLITHDGHALGTLCVMDYKAGALSATQKTQLADMAATTTALIETKGHEQILQQANNYQLGTIVEIAPNEIYLVDTASGKIKYANRAAQLSIGCNLEKLKLLSWNEILILSPEELINCYLQTNKSFFSSPINFQATQKRSDGSTYPVDCRIQACSSLSNDFLIISDDISQRIEAENREKSLQTNIAHANRINTASTLSSGLAHELNQPLTAINQYCSAALSIIEKQQNNTESTLLLESLQKAASQSIRAGEIIKRFRAFTERRQPTRELININALLDETVSLLSHDINLHCIELSLNVHDNLPTLNADPIQIQQVLLNLITNSIQATQCYQNSKIDIACAPCYNAIIQFTVTDNGPGMDYDLIDDLLLQSNSTKPNGSGLGLSICKSIISSHNGKLWHDKKYNQGTRIHFSLPILHTETNVETNIENNEPLK